MLSEKRINEKKRNKKKTKTKTLALISKMLTSVL